jgi:beta-lactam-binding protein with PASTA domain
MADVYVAEDRRLGRKVAVKILHGEYASSAAFVERFRREAQAAANLTHPGVVAVHDWGEDDGTYFMVMELVQGNDLRDLLREEGALMPRQVAEIGVAAAAALSAAHAQGLVHRDVKPGNILLTDDGGVKVADFGIARAFDDSEQLTRTGAVIGTASYFSPEQAQGHAADARSDIYSLGVVMYELLTGQPPFTGEGAVAVAYQHVKETPEPPSWLNPNIPEGLEAVVLKAMAKDPADRYQSAAELSEDLKRVLAGEVPLAAPVLEAPTRLMPSEPAPPVYDEPATPHPDRPGFFGPNGPDRTTIVIGVLAIAALVTLGVILMIRLVGGSEAGPLTVPDVRGMELAEARSTLDDAGLMRTGEEVVADANLAAGLAAGTDPAAGTAVVEGAEVVLLVSGGPADIQVPRVIDRTLDEARALIEGAGLEVGNVSYEPSPVIEADVVMSQDPASGVLLARGEKVDLVVSAGSDAKLIPDVVGKTEADALFTLEQAGFDPSEISIVRRPSADVPEGFVIETDPPATEALPPGGLLTLVVSQGAVPSVVPDVLGETPEDATVTLEDFGFEVALGSEVALAWNDPDDGLVVAQNPAAGQTLEFGSLVTIQVGRAATEVSVPSLVGDVEAAAKTELESAGLVWSKGADTLLAPGDGNIGKVVSQDPAAGTSRPVGSTVTVSVGVEGATVPNLFTGGSGGCANAVTMATAQSRITAAGLVMSTGTPSNEYSYSSNPGDNTHTCEGRTVEQSPPPGTVVAPGSTVTVSFDIVLAPEAADIYGLNLADAQLTFSVFTWTQSTENGGMCFDAIPAYNGKIRRISPQPEQTIPFVSNQYEVLYWLATTTAGPPACPPFP